MLGEFGRDPRVESDSGGKVGRLPTREAGSPLLQAVWNPMTPREARVPWDHKNELRGRNPPTPPMGRGCQVT